MKIIDPWMLQNYDHYREKKNKSTQRTFTGLWHGGGGEKKHTPMCLPG